MTKSKNFLILISLFFCLSFILAGCSKENYIEREISHYHLEAKNVDEKWTYSFIRVSILDYKDNLIEQSSTIYNQTFTNPATNKVYKMFHNDYITENKYSSGNFTNPPNIKLYENNITFIVNIDFYDQDVNCYHFEKIYLREMDRQYVFDIESEIGDFYLRIY